MPLYPASECDIYVSVATGIAIEARKIEEGDADTLKDYFHPSLFKPGDYVIVWPGDLNASILTSNVFEERFKLNVLKSNQKRKEDNDNREQGAVCDAPDSGAGEVHRQGLVPAAPREDG